MDHDVVVTLDGSDSHRDHATVRDATLAVTRERALPAYLQRLSREHLVEVPGSGLS